MHFNFDNIYLRNIETEDLQNLHMQKNDPEVTASLGGFSTGYSFADLKDWFEYHRKKKDELLLSIVDKNSESCIGHVGLYNIDYRIRSAEFAIMIGDKEFWGKGIGRICTKFLIDYGFNELNLNRIYLSLLSSNERALNLYTSLGFKHEGTQRSAQFKNGSYQDVILMGVLKEDLLNV
jgi:RimJ/RimL family protein N-acetyltransferase